MENAKEKNERLVRMIDDMIRSLNENSNTLMKDCICMLSEIRDVIKEK